MLYLEPRVFRHSVVNVLLVLHIAGGRCIIVCTHSADGLHLRTAGAGRRL